MWMLFGVTLTGFVAQLIGGTIGMGFGVTATTGLLLASYTPPVASSIVHFVEIGTSLLNGTFHAKQRNIDWRVTLTVGLPGAAGAFIGAILLSSADLSFTKPWTASVLILLGIFIIVRNANAQRTVSHSRPRSFWVAPLGLGAGFVDATAGGGWGIMTTSTLVASNTMAAGRVVGTTSSARLFVAVAGSLGFLIGLGAENIDWLAVIVMLIGCLIAAPIAAKLVTVLPSRTIALTVGVVVIGLNVRQLMVSLDADFGLVVLTTLGSIVAATVFVVLLTRKIRSSAQR